MLMHYECDRARQLGERGSLGREGRGECCGNYEVPMLQSPPMSVKDRTVLAPMANFELCTGRMLGFMGPDKPSRFCNYFVEPHLLASYGAGTFGGRMRLRAKTSSREQGSDFDLVGTYEWLSYVRASGSQAYGVLVGFFPLQGYIDSSHRDTLAYE
jgi:hypothetical protein